MSSALLVNCPAGLFNVSFTLRTSKRVFLLAFMLPPTPFAFHADVSPSAFRADIRGTIFPNRRDATGGSDLISDYHRYHLPRKADKPVGWSLQNMFSVSDGIKFIFNENL